MKWQLLAEFLVPIWPGIDGQARAQVGNVLREVGLEPRQVGRVESLIDQTLQDQEGAHLPLHLRISVSSVDLGNTPGTGDGNKARVHPEVSGPGFFVVKRIAGRPQDPFKGNYRVVEVLVYWEG